LNKEKKTTIEVCSLLYDFILFSFLTVVEVWGENEGIVGEKEVWEGSLSRGIHCFRIPNLSARKR
jgi:hypothetical protein